MSGVLNNTYTDVTFSLNRHTAALGKLQEQMATGSHINRASDDPTGAYRVLGLSTQERALSNHMANVQEASDLIQSTSMAIEDMSGAMAQAKVNLTQIVSGTYGDGATGQQARSRMAGYIDDTLEQMVLSANTQVLGQYVFGGNASNTAPYTVTRSDGQITSVTYAGSEQNRDVELSPGVTTTVFETGSGVFQNSDRGTPVVDSVTGAGIGSGTSSVTGDAWLTVTNDGTNYKLSIDGGTTEVTVPLVGDVSNMAVTNAAGKVLYVDATNLSSTGLDMVRVPGTYDAFNVLLNLRDLLLNTQDLSESQQVSLIEASSASLQELTEILAEKQVTLGSSIGFLENHRERLDGIRFNVQSERSQVEEADIAQIAIDLSRHEVLYQMSLQIASKLMSTSLLDFI
ncbi:MAG: flagellar hook-associated protein FlgL [Phycisphaeraceae bacterium]|nr:flagellar hook-associated protein FlgL [Phycisphaeraceae bacterium]